MEKKRLKLLKEVRKSDLNTEIIPESDEQYQNAKYLWDNELIDAVHCSDNPKSNDIPCFRQVKITPSGCNYLVYLERRHPSFIYSFVKWLVISIPVIAGSVTIVEYLHKLKL